MDYDLNKIKDLAIGSSLVKNPTVSFLAEGFGNYNYLVEEGNSKFVLRLRKKCERQFNDSLERENSFLKYFESKGINFCPKVVYYDKENNFLIEKFIEGKMVSQENFSKKEIDLFAKQLLEMFSLSISDFSNYCKKNNLREFGYDGILDSLKVYGFNRFEEAKENGLQEDVTSWIKTRLDENYDYLSGLNIDENDLGFHWGDIQTEVFIDDANKMTFYDFEHAEIYPSPGLSYIKIHGKFSSFQFGYLLDRYSHYSGKNKKELLDNIVNEERITRVNDVVWAAMKWAENGESEFKELTYDRMKLVEDLENSD